MSTLPAPADEPPPPRAPAAVENAAPGYQRPPARELIEQWSRLIDRLSAVLHAPEAASFEASVAGVDAALQLLADNDADRVVFVATFLAESEARHYCAAHSLYVALACHLASRAIDGWDDRRRAQLRGAALTMNIAMASQQDQMARQYAPLDADQRALIDSHETRGAQRLRELGIADTDWTEAVAQHHRTGPGALDTRSPAEQMARLIQRADRLTAAHSIRAGRAARSAGDASRAAYLDEMQQPDAAGAALVKALGIYPPGSLVRLANAEVAIVIRRGERADQPHVVAVVRADGLPQVSPKPRDTAQPAMKVIGSLAQETIKLRLSLEALVKLT